MIRRGIGVQSYVSAGGGTDADAQAFITAAGITDATQQSAINTLVVDLKTYGIWTKMKAIYPFVGGTASAHKFNLKDPRDLDAAFRLVFSGGWIHSSNGALPNGTNAYADTKIVPASVLMQNSTHLGYYSRTNSIGGSDIGSCNPIYTFLNFLNLRFTGDVYYCHLTSTAAQITGTSINSQGFYIGSRTSSTLSKFYKNGSTINSSAAASQGLTTSAVWVGGTNFAGAVEYSNRQTAFASIGDGLTDTEAANLYTAVQAYQTTLSRNV